MIEQGCHPLEVVARETGFRDRRHLREVFIRKLGVPPQATRRRARAWPPRGSGLARTGRVLCVSGGKVVDPALVVHQVVPGAAQLEAAP